MCVQWELVWSGFQIFDDQDVDMLDDDDISDSGIAPPPYSPPAMPSTILAQGDEDKDTPSPPLILNHGEPRISRKIPI